MGWFSKRLQDIIKLPIPTPTQYLGNWADIDAGIIVDRETALEISTVFACFYQLANDVGQIPLNVYQYTKTGRDKAPWTREGKAFKNGPNAYQTTQDWIEQIMLHLLWYGDYYAQIFRVGGYLDQLAPVEYPLTVKTQIIAGRQVHTWNGQEYSQDDMFHIHGPSVDGYRGRDFVDNHRQSLALAKAISRYGANFYANGGQMSGILILPASSTPDQVKAAKALFNATYGQAQGKTHQVAAYAAGTDFKSTSVDPEKAQALGLRTQLNKEIAALWKMPMWRLYGEQSPTGEARNAYYADTISPWLVRIASNINKYLMSSDLAYVEFNTAALLRSDIKTRYQAYMDGINARFLNPNECRAWENLDGYAGGEVFINPNVMSADATAAHMAAQAGASATR